MSKQFQYSKDGGMTWELSSPDGVVTLVGSERSFIVHDVPVTQPSPSTGGEPDFPHPDCDWACHYHCTEAGAHPPKCAGGEPATDSAGRIRKALKAALILCDTDAQQSPDTGRQYPELPEPRHPDQGIAKTDAYTAEQMFAYGDACREFAARRATAGTTAWSEALEIAATVVEISKEATPISELAKQIREFKR